MQKISDIFTAIALILGFLSFFGARAAADGGLELPNVWGQGGALFAFSGFDGETDCRHPFVGSTSWDGRGITFHTEAPASLRFKLPSGGESGEFSSQDEIVAGDVISSVVGCSGAKLRLRYLFLDKDTVVGEVKALEAPEPVDVCIAAEVERSQVERQGDTMAFHAGSEEFVLAGKGPGLEVNEGGVSARLSPGESLKFAFLYCCGSLPDVEKRSAVALSVDQQELFGKRVAFFKRLPKPKSDDPLLRRTYYKCASVQKVNCATAQGAILFDWTTPDRWPHKYMWIWDSAFHALGLRHFAPEWARNAVKAVLSKQRPDGFIPHKMTPDDKGDSKIIQPPILSWAAWKVYKTAGDGDFLRYCYPRLKAIVLFDCRQMDADHNGLSEWGHKFASGMDNSPRFDQPVGDAVDLNAYLVNDMFYLEKMAQKLGLKTDAQMWAQMRSERSRKINELLWDQETGFYYDLDTEGGQIKIKTAAGFTPLFAGICSREQAAALVEHLTDPKEFRRAFPLPSLSADEPAFCDDMWRGPVWVNCNYLAIEGLDRYGYRDKASELRRITLSEIARWYGRDGVIYEFYDSEGRRSPAELHRKGKAGVRVGARRIGPCVRDYHWTAAIFVDQILSK